MPEPDEFIGEDCGVKQYSNRSKKKKKNRHDTPAAASDSDAHSSTEPPGAAEGDAPARTVHSLDPH